MLEAGTEIGAYVLTEPLHEGELADYWLARTQDDRAVVVSVLRPGYFTDPEVRSLVLDRMEERAAVRHPRIPRLIEHFSASIGNSDRYVASYAYVPGVSCEVLLGEEEGGLPFAVAGRIVGRLARIIDETRVSPGWVSFCCLHPGGVILTSGGEAWWLLTPRIDAMPPELSEIDLLRLRSPQYMAPEIITGEAQLPQSTVFSLGVLLFELLTGVHPFRGDTLLETLMNIRSGTRPALSELVEVPGEVERILDTALAPDFGTRAPLPRVLADQLDEVLGAQDSDHAVAEYVRRRRPALALGRRANDDTVPDAPADVELLGEIAKDRTNPEPYLVYADWLQARGSPRGELIVLHHRLSSTTGEAERDILRRREERLFAENPSLTGALTEWLLGDERGTVFFDPHPHFVGPPDRGPLALDWFLGFIRAARISVTPPESADGIKRLLRCLEQEESAQLLSELTVGFTGPPGSVRLEMDRIYDALSSSRLDVRSLFLGDLASSHPTTEHRGLGNICAVFPHLRRLSVRGGRIRMGQLPLPKLEELRIFSSGLEATTLSQLASSRLHALRLLELWFGGPPHRDAWPDRVGLLFEEGVLPSLEHLAICEGQPGALAATLAVLAESPLAPRLITLEIRHSVNVRDVVLRLLGRADRFQRLERLVVGPKRAVLLRDRVSARLPGVELV